MKRNFLAAAAMLLLAWPVAHAAAWSQGSIGGMSVDQLGSGANFTYFSFGKDLEPGQTYSQTFDYSFTLHNDGLAAERTWSSCAPIDAWLCGPAPTGVEAAQVNFGMLTRKDSGPWVTYDISGLSPWVPISVAPGQSQTFSGTFTITETMDSQPGAAFVNNQLFVYAATWIDSGGPLSSVPEPMTGFLLAAGLLIIGASSPQARPFRSGLLA